MFWCEHIYVAFSTIYIGYLTLRRKSAYLRRKKISCSGQTVSSMQTRTRRAAKASRSPMSPCRAQTIDLTR